MLLIRYVVWCLGFLSKSKQELTVKIKFHNVILLCRSFLKEDVSESGRNMSSFEINIVMLD